jgi:hypothetical protein
MFNKLTLAVLGVTVSGMTMAGSMGPVCAPGNVTVPCEKMAWDVGVDALYLQPTLSNALAYYDSYQTTTAIDWKAFDRWNWGFKLEGSYHFNTGNDVTIDWYHLNSNNTYTLSGSDISNRLNIKWDAVNAELAQFADFSMNKKIRFHGGVAYARIRSNKNYYSSGALLNATPTWTTSFSGIGPRGGVDLNYVFGNGLGIYAKAAAALLVGTGSYSSYTNTGISLAGSRNPVIPELDSKLGAVYTYHMAQGSLSIDAGWLWTNYFQAQHKDADFCDANFSLSGPYIGVNYVGNV